MTQVSLGQTLQQNRQLVGPHFEHLGKREGIYLSYCGQTGWSVVQFSKGVWGVIQRALRYLGLYYRSTHLKAVLDQIGRERDDPYALSLKLQAAWRRRLGTELRLAEPPPSIYGTSSAPLEPKKRKVLEANQDDCVGIYLGADQHTCLTIEKGERSNPRTKAIVEIKDRSQFVGTETEPAFVSTLGEITQRGVSHAIQIARPLYVADSEPNRRASRQALRDICYKVLERARTEGIRSLAIPVVDLGIEPPLFDEALKLIAITIRDYVDTMAANHFNEIKFLVPPEQFTPVQRILSEVPLVVLMNADFERRTLAAVGA